MRTEATPGLLAAIAQYEAISAGQSSDAGIVYHNFLGTTPMQNLMGNLSPMADQPPLPNRLPSS
jgi:hypothetical protein